MPVYSLTDLNQHIRDTLEDNYPDAIWVQAEIASLNRNAFSGHCYLELVDGPAQQSRARAMIWKKTFDLLHSRFKVQTGSELSAGLKIQVLVKVEFSLQYGLSLIVWDLDAAFTLGNLELVRQETLRRLRNEGLLETNKSLALPRPVQRLALISSPTAAGLEDFEVHLLRSEYGFFTQLFPAPMQGLENMPAVVQAFAQVAAQKDKFDVVILLRGGGSKLDLQLFDQYELGKALALCPLPVLTGIGHERDESVCDQVAFRSFKTPTAVASWLLELLAEADNGVTREMQRIAQLAQWRLQQEVAQTGGLLQRLTNRMKEQVQVRNDSLRALTLDISRKAFLKIQQHEKVLSRTEWELQELNPLSVLKKGYARVFQDQTVKKTRKEISMEKPILVQLQDGKLNATPHDLP